MADRKVTVQVAVTGNATALNAALAQSQAQAAALKQSVASVASAMPQVIQGPRVAPAQVQAPRVAPSPQVVTPTQMAAINAKYGTGVAQQFVAAGAIKPAAAGSATAPIVSPTTPVVPLAGGSHAHLARDVALAESRARADYAATPLGQRQQRQQYGTDQRANLAAMQARVDYLRGPVAGQHVPEEYRRAAELHAQQARHTLAFASSSVGQGAAGRQMGIDADIHAQQLRARLAFTQSATGRHQGQQRRELAGREGIEQTRQEQTFRASGAGRKIGYDQQELTALGRVQDAEQRLAFLRSGPGSAATVQAIQAEQQLAKQQEYLGKVARQGRASAAFDTAADKLNPALSLANRGAMYTGGLVAGGVAATPVLAEQLGNSFRYLAGEIGISVIPVMVEFSGVVQGVARTWRRVNEATGGRLGSGLAYTALGLGAVGLAGQGLNMARGAVRGLSWGASVLGVAAPAAGQVAGAAATRVGGAVAGRAAGAGIGTLAGGAAAGGVGAVGAGIGVPAAAIAAPVAAIVLGTLYAAASGYQAYQARAETQELAARDPRRTGGWQAMEYLSRTASFNGLGGRMNLFSLVGFGANAAAQAMGLPALSNTANPWGDRSQAPTRRDEIVGTGVLGAAGGWLGERTGIGERAGRIIGGGTIGAIGTETAQATGLGGGVSTLPMLDQRGQLSNSVESLFDRMAIEQTTGTPQEREQDARAYAELSARLSALNSSIDRLNGTIDSASAASGAE